jgi:hypothetical protein
MIYVSVISLFVNTEVEMKFRKFKLLIYINIGKVTSDTGQPELKRLVTGFPPWRSILVLVKWDLWWTKWRWGRFSLSTLVSPANLHSTKFSIIIITWGRYNRSFSGRRAKWTQFGLHPHYVN